MRKETKIYYCSTVVAQFLLTLDKNDDADDFDGESVESADKDPGKQQKVFSLKIKQTIFSGSRKTQLLATSWQTIHQWLNMSRHSIPQWSDMSRQSIPQWSDMSWQAIPQGSDMS